MDGPLRQNLWIEISRILVLNSPIPEKNIFIIFFNQGDYLIQSRPILALNSWLN